MQIFQYQSLAEPLSEIPEAVHLNWLPRMVDRVSSPPAPIPELNTVPVFQETPISEGWLPRFDDKIITSPKEFGTGIFAYDFGIATTETVYLDKYAPRYTDRVQLYQQVEQALPAGYFSYDFGVVTKENIYPDKWIGRYSDRAQNFQQVEQALPAGIFSYDFGIATSPVVYLDKYEPRYPDQPTKPIPSVVHADWLFYDFGVATIETVYPDKYAPRYQDRITVFSEFQTGSFTTGELVNLTVPNGWSPTFRDRVVQPSVPFPTGSYSYDFGISTSETVYLDKWIGRYVDKVSLPPYVVKEGDMSFDIGVFTLPIVYLDKYSPRYTDKVVLSPAEINTGMFSYDLGYVTNEVIYPDKYAPRYVDRIFTLKEFQTGYFSTGELLVYAPVNWFPVFTDRTSQPLRPTQAEWEFFDVGKVFVRLTYPSQYGPYYVDKVPRSPYVVREGCISYPGSYPTVYSSNNVFKITDSRSFKFKDPRVFTVIDPREIS